MFFIDTGEALLAVTARHVYEKYREWANHHDALRGGLEVSATSGLIRIFALTFVSENVGFRTSRNRASIFLRSKSRRVSLPHSASILFQWPPDAPEVGGCIVVAGYAGCLKEYDPTEGVLDFGFGSRFSRISAVSGRHFQWNRTVCDPMIDVLGYGLPTDPFNYGGFSGGPVASVVRTEGGLGLGVVGVIEEGHVVFGVRDVGVART